MPTGMRKCKVCGKFYEYCKTNRPTGVFRFQDVACCPEHAAIYFAKIAESRSQSVEPAKIKENSVVTTAPVENSDEEDELFEEEFDDGAEELEIEL